MFCSYCGNKVPDNAKFCGVCGAVIVANQQGTSSVNSTAQAGQGASKVSRVSKAAKSAATGAATVQVPKAALITLITVACVGVIGIAGVATYKLIDSGLKKNTPERIKDTITPDITEANISDEALDAEDSAVDGQTEEAVIRDIAEDNVADYLYPQVTDKSKYIYYKSTVSNFAFGYPGALFSSRYDSTEETEGHYGTVVEEIHFSGSDGSFANFVLSKRTDGVSIEDMMEIAYSFENRFISSPVELLYESRGSYGEVVLRGYNDDSNTTTVFNLTHVTDDYVMQMKLYCPKAEDEDVRQAVEQYYQNMYEACSFARIKIDDLGAGTYVEIGEVTDPAAESNESSDASIALVEDDSIGYSEYGWSAAYCEYMNKLAAAGKEYDYEYAALVYINNDSIPELILAGMYEAMGNEILTYKNGRIDVLTTDRLDFAFIERGNILRNATSSGNYYVDNVYCIKNGKWKALQQHNGDVNSYIDSKYDAIFNEAYQNGTVCYDYKKEDFTSMWDYLLFIDE